MSNITGVQIGGIVPPPSEMERLLENKGSDIRSYHRHVTHCEATREARKVGIVGFGVVGKSVHNLLSKSGSVDEIFIYDPPKGRFQDFFNAIAIFICLPTPTVESKQDLSIMKSMIKHFEELKYKGLIVVKSTILPSYAKELEKSNLKIIHSPEFLNQSDPYCETDQHIIGANENAMPVIGDYLKLFPDCKHKLTDIATAAMIKYVHNVHGALKVAFFNEIFDVCESEEIDYREMMRILLSQNDNIGKQYTTIGADGKRGFDGKCFPKDILAFNSEYYLKTLKGAIRANENFHRVEMIECMKTTFGESITTTAAIFGDVLDSKMSNMEKNQELYGSANL